MCLEPSDMAFFWKWTLSFVLMQGCFVLLRSITTDMTHAQILRGHELMNIQFIMVLASYLFYTYRYKFLLQKVAPSPGHRSYAALFLVFVGAVHIAYSLHYLGTSNSYAISLFCFLCVAVYIHLMAFSVGFTIEEHLVYWILPTRYQLPVLTSKSLHTAISIFMALTLTIHGVVSTSNHISVYDVDVQLEKLPKSLDKFSIALITDVHIGPTVHKSRVEEIVQAANSVNADAIAIVGDLVDGFVSSFGETASPLKKLRSKHGVFYATGNHEYYHDDVDNWLKYFRDTLNITVLHNQHKTITMGNSSICIAGVDDYHTRRLFIDGHSTNPVAATKGCPDGVPLVLLAHQPSAAKYAISLVPDKVDLVLSGHTHAGQFYVIWPVAYLSNTFLHGLYKDLATGVQVFVSAGVNYWGPPVKMWNLCEIPVIRLHPVSAKA